MVHDAGRDRPAVAAPQRRDLPPLGAPDDGPDDARSRRDRAGGAQTAERDAHDALECAARIEAHQGIPDILECIAGLAGDAGSDPDAARLFGAAAATRQRTGEVRFQIYQAGYAASLAALRDAMGEEDFDCAWAEGVALSTEEAIAYAQRGPGERKPPTTGKDCPE